MNREFAIKLVHQLESIPRGQFDMRDWIKGCGTVACVAGWATLIADGEEANGGWAEKRGRELLELNAWQARQLFLAHGRTGRQYWEAGPKSAAEVIRLMLADGGVVDWDKAVANAIAGHQTPIREEEEAASLLARADTATEALRVATLPEPPTAQAPKTEKVKL